MKWSILILTQPSRSCFLSTLLKVIKPQVERYNDIELVITYFNKEYKLGKNRSIMIQAAAGEYVNFIDDDDLIPDDYVDTIYPLLNGVDYIGFLVDTYVNGVFYKRSDHSLKHCDWIDTKDCNYRDISHLNPIRRELALAGCVEKFEVADSFEDKLLADILRTLGVVKTETYIPRSLYYYYYRTNKCD